MKFVRGIHLLWAIITFGILFAIAFLILLIPIVNPRFHQITGIVNRWWARIWFTLIFIPFKVEYREELDPKKPCIFCPNHFSYLDIPTMGLNKYNTIFVGKNDMESIPLFGFMYRKLHITVDRNSLKSKYGTLLKTLEAIDDGKKPVIFPEGGIITQNPPEMARFKDGAFRAAIEKQIPIIPVTIPFNWIILPDSTFLPRRRSLKVIFHKPISTIGLTLKDTATLKAKTIGVIEEELKRQLNEN